MLVVCDEMKKFRKILDDNNIAWQDKSVTYLSDELRREIVMYICRTHFEYKQKFWSVINGFGTYGGYFGLNNDCLDGTDNVGLLEIMGDDDPIGWLTADEAWNLIQELSQD